MRLNNCSKKPFPTVSDFIQALSCRREIALLWLPNLFQIALHSVQLYSTGPTNWVGGTMQGVSPFYPAKPYHSPSKLSFAIRRRAPGC